ncbi:hypothetical protein ACFWWS_36510 [Streptomyces sp. NPDC059083]|uniref:hypothetical protein n=1 Tax=Streptomyces sp. NPDC059083 TaxID=3346721 RepID=UPI0036BF1B1B
MTKPYDYVMPMPEPGDPIGWMDAEGRVHIERMSDDSVWPLFMPQPRPDPFAHLAPEFLETLERWLADIRALL